ncbi:DNA topoisomerase [Chytridium lagenaria]|nr:DNA topoisomerase [Chytridium lagenaria]
MTRRVLCVAEKNRAAKEISQILALVGSRRYDIGRFQRRYLILRCAGNTKCTYIKNYGFSSTFEGNACQVVMTSVKGHVMEYEFEIPYRNWTSCAVSKCFEAPVEKIAKGKKEAKKAATLIIWTDCDDEGEILVQRANKRIVIRRARFSTFLEAYVSLLLLATKACRSDIRRAWYNLTDLNFLHALAIDARREIDLRLAMVCSYVFSLTNIVGSCQFPTLGFVVDQFERVQSFACEPFWFIEVFIEIPGGKRQSFTWLRQKLFDHQIALAIYENCFLNPTGVITQVKTKPAEKWRPIPLATVDLLKFCSSYFKLPSHETIEIAESLYIEGYISYPRTETDEFTDSESLRDTISKFIQSGQYGAHAQGLLDGKFRHPRRGGHNDNAHPPIHPLKDGELAGNKQKVFNFICRRFLACCSDNAKGVQTKVELRISTETFNASGLYVTERNYLEIYPFDKWESTSVGEFRVGEELMPSVLQLSTGYTSKPKCLTEAELIGMMERNSIGTDATIHEHIRKIEEREYVNKENERYVPTLLGIGLARGYKQINLDLSLMKPYLRSQLEASIKAIKDRSKTKQEVLDVDYYINMLSSFSTFDFVGAQEHFHVLRLLVMAYT